MGFVSGLLLYLYYITSGEFRSKTLSTRGGTYALKKGEVFFNSGLAEKIDGIDNKFQNNYGKENGKNSSGKT